MVDFRLPSQDTVPLEERPTNVLFPRDALDELGSQSRGPLSGDAGEADEDVQLGRTARPPRRIRTGHVMAVLVGLALVAMAALSAFFVWDRWYRFDDSIDIQGVWFAEGSEVPITITSDSILFTPDIAYSYALDSATKSLEFALGHLSGSCHYWFADNRQVLVLADGTNFTRWGTAADDLMRQLREFSDLSAGKGASFPDGTGVMMLSRDPYHGAVAPDDADEPGNAEMSDGSTSGSGGAASPDGNSSDGAASSEYEVEGEPSGADGSETQAEGNPSNAEGESIDEGSFDNISDR